MFSEKEVTRTKELRSRLLSYDPDNYIQVLWDKKGKAQYMTSVMKREDLSLANVGKAIPCYLQTGITGKTYTVYGVLNMSKERITLDFTHALVAARNDESGAKPHKIMAEFEFTMNGTKVHEWRKGKKTEDTGYIYPDIFAEEGFFQGEE